MKLFFDDRLITTDSNENGYKIIYSPDSHSTVKINDEANSLLTQIIKIGSGTEFDLAKLIETEDELIDTKKLISRFVKNKILFYSESEQKNNSMSFRIDKLNENIIKKFSLRIAYLHVTQRCNFSCEYCYNKKNLNRQSELTTKQWLTAIDNLKDAGITTYIVTGGEPLLRNDLQDILAHIKNNGGYTQLLTNGSLLTRSNHNVLQHVDGLIVSLDSIDKEINEANRANSINYDIISNLINLPAEYKNKVTVRSVLTKNNIADIAKIKDYVINKLGLKYVTSIYLPNSAEDVELIPTISDEVIGELSETTLFPKNQIISCGGCYKEIGVDSNGDIYPCQNLIMDEFYITNILESNWLDVLKNSAITKKFMDIDIRKRAVCNTCKYMYLCGGACRALTYKIYNSLDVHPDFLCKQFEKMNDNKLKTVAFKNIIIDTSRC